MKLSIRELAIVMAVAAIMSGCKKKVETVEEERVEQVRVTRLAMREIDREISISANLQGWETVNVAPSLTGKIEHIFVEEDARVTQGQPLVRMDQTQYRTTKLQYANLGVEMGRLSALRETGSVSQQAYDQTKVQYDQLKENLDFLEQNTFVKAPFAGVISAKNYEDGELYSGAPILQLVQITTLKALIAIPETYFPLIKQGMKVELTSEIYPGDIFPATIDVVFPTIDPSSHTFQAKLRIANSSMKLRPGMYVVTKLSLGKDNTIVVPYQSVEKLVGANDRYVFINEGGRAKRVAVQLGQRFDQDVEIISPEIKEGVEMVTTGQHKLVDGVKLNINE
ncbi:MAG: efflux RND transporter periplasmic adaptor subunit [Paludibacteraceae bacterium]|nr:efflux RND transporter periplasmic adaptor subunit [Paludibacteraceae bacterium]